MVYETQLISARPLNLAEPAPALTGKLRSCLESDRMKAGLVFPSAWDRVLPASWKPIKSISAKNPKLLRKIKKIPKLSPESSILGFLEGLLFRFPLEGGLKKYFSSIIQKK